PKIGIWKNKITEDRGELRKHISELSETAKTQNYGKIVSQIKILIPEYIGDTYKITPHHFTAESKN
ncbi:MAG: hypothetical protein PHF37_09195, partial [Phycisphaerae bacterium]|nr:hypothetical protein [Phycisphaerae bacterium]